MVIKKRLIFIDGTAGIGKTTFMKQLEKNNSHIKVANLDYLNFVKHYDPSSERGIICYRGYLMSEMDEKYLEWYRENLEAAKVAALSDDSCKVLIIDRSPISNAVYSYVKHGLLEADQVSKPATPIDIRHLNKIFYEFLNEYTEENLLSHFYTEFVVGIDETNIMNIVERMKERGNGIDILDEQYVLVQNQIFKQVYAYYAQNCKVSFFNCSSKSPYFDPELHL